MAEREKLVGKASEFKDGDRRIVFLGNTEVGIFRDKGEYYAYSNYCLHQGGPACEGLIIAKVEERIMPDQTSRGLYFSEEEQHFVCPWHGYEYDMKTGECVSDRKTQAAEVSSRAARRRSLCRRLGLRQRAPAPARSHRISARPKPPP